MADNADGADLPDETVRARGPLSHRIRRAVPSDSDTLGVLLDRFNREYDEPTPGPAALGRRMRQLTAGGDTVALVPESRIQAGRDGPGELLGIAVLRFRSAIWSEALECYLAELYVVPEYRGRGIGRSLLVAAMDAAREQGADYMDLGTSEADVAARGLYESLGFSNREGRPDGPINYYYEREL